MPQKLDQRSRTWIGRTLLDRNGHRIGRVEDIYTDDVGGHPAWIAVATGRFGVNIIFLPFAGAVPAGGDELRVQFSKSLIKDAPAAGQGDRLTQEEVVRLYDHYGFDLEAEEVRERASNARSGAANDGYRPVRTHEPVPAAEPSRARREEPVKRTKDTAARVEERAALLDKLFAPEQPQTPAPPPPVRPAAPAADAAASADDAPRRSISALLREMTEAAAAGEQAARPDSPLYWNHDDRIDSIRPPREAVPPTRR
jgi:hypothetical protein